MKKLGVFGTAIWLLCGCSADHKVVGRQISPNQKLVAVLTEVTAGDSVRKEIYLNDQGVPLNLDAPVFTGVGCEHLSFDWANDYTLQIHYESLCAIGQFTNRWYRPSDLAVGRPVPIEIVLIRQ